MASTQSLRHEWDNGTRHEWDSGLDLAFPLSKCENKGVKKKTNSNDRGQPNKEFKRAPTRKQAPDWINAPVWIMTNPQEKKKTPSENFFNKQEIRHVDEDIG